MHVLSKQYNLRNLQIENSSIFLNNYTLAPLVLIVAAR